MDETLTIGIRFALYADLMLVFGLPLFALYTPGFAQVAAKLRPAIIALAVTGAGLSIVSIAAMTAALTGVGLFAVAGADIAMVIAETPMGTAWLVRIAALVGLVGVMALRGGLTPATACAAVALASLAWAGHGAAGQGGWGVVRLIADIVHLLAAGAWLGALVAFAIMLAGSGNRQALHGALAGFAGAGTLLVALIVASGLANLVSLLDWSRIALLPATLYGQLLLIKLALFGLMLGIASLNRFRLTPAFGRGEAGAERRLQRSIALETGLGLIILALVAWFGTLEPGALA